MAIAGMPRASKGRSSVPLLSDNYYCCSFRKIPHPSLFRAARTTILSASVWKDLMTSDVSLEFLIDDQRRRTGQPLLIVRLGVCSAHAGIIESDRKERLRKRGSDPYLGDARRRDRAQHGGYLANDHCFRRSLPHPCPTCTEACASLADTEEAPTAPEIRRLPWGVLLLRSRYDFFPFVVSIGHCKYSQGNRRASSGSVPYIAFMP